MIDVLLIGPGDHLAAVAGELESRGHAVRQVADPVSALDVLATERVVCVAGTPTATLDGRQFVRQFRERTDEAAVVLVLDGDTPATVALRSGADDVVAADDPGDVADAIADVLAGRRLDDGERKRYRQRALLDRATEAVRAADSRSALETALCEALAPTDVYRVAWIGRRRDLGGRTGAETENGTGDGTVTGAGTGGAAVLQPVAAAGLPVDHLGGLPLDGETDTARALTDGEVAVETDGDHATVAVPFRADPAGVLYLYGDRPGGFPVAEREGLATLSGTVESVLERLTDEATDGDGEEPADRVAVLGDAFAHELSNHLDVATTHLDLARDRDDESHYEHVTRALERISALTDDARALARGSAEPEPVSLSALARSAWESVGTADASLRVTDATVEADREQIRLALENLLRNAVEHAGPEVTVTVGPLDVEGGDGEEGADEHGTTGEDHPPRAAGFFVADDGPGIPAERRTEVLEWGTSFGEGSGVGLGIVALVAERHGWTVEITESDEGGARFEIR